MGSLKFSVFSVPRAEQGCAAVGTQYSVPSTQCAVSGGLRSPQATRHPVLRQAASHSVLRLATRHSVLSTEYFVPASRRPSPRSGLSLIEVLASIGILSIGILGLAALLPVGQVTIFEATKADRTGNCGRAAMRDVVVRRILDYHTWYDQTEGKFVYDPSYKGPNSTGPWFDQNGNATAGFPAAFIIDPLGATAPAPPPPLAPLNRTLGNNLTVSGTQTSWLTNVPRISLATIYPPYPAPGAVPQTYQQYTNPMAWLAFSSTDDLVAPPPEQMSPPRPPGRPLNFNSAGNPAPLASGNNYTWFASVVPEPNNPTRFTVSVVVCYRRAFNAAAEQAVPVSNFWDGQQMINGASGQYVALGGGSVLLNVPIGGANSINVRENDWVALCNKTGICRWYRVIAIGDDTSQLTLSGPDWPYAASSSIGTPTSGDMLVALGQDVLGVYTTTVDLDTDATWKN